MQILDHLDAFSQEAYASPVLALGNFDGVHLGHQAILHHVRSRVQAVQGTGMVFTFEPHPLRVLRPQHAPPLLTTFEQKMKLIAAEGIEIGLRVPFTDVFAKQQPHEFIQEVLCGTIGARELVVGYDFRFGHQRSGTVEHLREAASTYGYQVTVVPAITVAGLTVSSSNIRKLVRQGEVEDASRLLGRYYAIEGPVVAGFRRGRTIGFPTANVQSVNEIVPQTGVYAVRVTWREMRLNGVANVGYNPTFGNEALSVEAHLFEFEDDLYGETLCVEFVKKIRDERKFDSVDELIAQIAQDANQARDIHARLASSPWDASGDA
jgi:riboflavin kinase/FMN adenylyltransferase